MSKEYVIVPKEDYVDTCDAIREKINSTALLKSNEMAQAVRDISASAKEEQEKIVEIKENSTTVILPDENKTLSKAIVNVNVPSEDEDFIGVKYSDFNTAYRLPKVADATSFAKMTIGLNTEDSKALLSRVFASRFASTATTPSSLHNKLETVYLPSGISQLNSTFSNDVNLKNIIGDLSSVIATGYTFSYCSALEKVPYMPNLSNIGRYSFQNCTSLKKINFYTKPSNFDAYVFNGSTNLTDIYVSWSEGEVANAPWGATNATIHYNTTFDDEHNPIIEEA